MKVSDNALNYLEMRGRRLRAGFKQPNYLYAFRGYARVTMKSAFIFIRTQPSWRRRTPTWQSGYQLYNNNRFWNAFLYNKRIKDARHFSRGYKRALRSKLFAEEAFRFGKKKPFKSLLRSVARHRATVIYRVYYRRVRFRDKTILSVNRLARPARKQKIRYSYGPEILLNFSEFLWTAKTRAMESNLPNIHEHFAENFMLNVTPFLIRYKQGFRFIRNNLIRNSLDKRAKYPRLFYLGVKIPLLAGIKPLTKKLRAKLVPTMQLKHTWNKFHFHKFQNLFKPYQPLFSR